MTEHHNSLVEELSQIIPRGVELNAYHISTPPTTCPSLYAAPPNQGPERTYCESHSLLTTITSDSAADKSSEVAVFAIELQIYTTEHLTTAFVSKADSTGYLSLLNLPRHIRSVLQSVTSTFVSWVIRRRHRPDRRLVLSLFARAQNQYLFPGSVENGKKHILDDRGLVKWWCKTLDPVLREYHGEADGGNPLSTLPEDEQIVRAKAHLIVPGHDSYETQAFFPKSFRADPPIQKRWINSHPLRQLSAYPDAPPRCLVPHFPDDPKTRFLNDLDDEIADAAQSSQSSAGKKESPSKRGKGQWKSVKTLEQFWELMAFRQECSSGRLVGFLWIVFTPDSLFKSADGKSSGRLTSPWPLPRKRKSSDYEQEDTLPTEPAKRVLRPVSRENTRVKKRLKGPIYPRSPRVKSFMNDARLGAASQQGHATQGKTTRFYHSPIEAQGTLVLSQKAYDRVHELLLRLDFSNLDVSISSTRRWIAETEVIAGLADNSASWGKAVIGTKRMEPTLDLAAKSLNQNGQSNGPTMLVTKKKPKSDNQNVDDKMTNSNANSAQESMTEKEASDTTAATSTPGSVNMLGPSLIRKKPKNEAPNLAPAVADQATPAAASLTDQNGVNTLGAGLVRKKARS